ncbi:MAG TPA: NAD(P)H-hydrate epimerase, partial [Novosphingobium sp.]|nr:NAD(P)H-hydrate epimerase [Novosphingobium sp.]
MSEQILTAQQMRTAEAELIAAGTSVEALMRLAGQGAAGFVWRMAGPGRMVTVLTGAGNNGGDGWVLAEAIRQRGGRVQVVMAAEPRTPAAISARAAYGGAVVAGAGASGAVLVDCLFGTGLTRPLEAGDLALLQGLAARHGACVAVDLPSGIEADSGAALNEGLPDYQLTIALGAWKFAHYLMPAAARMGGLRLVEIGVAPVAGAAQVLARPGLAAPAADAHKYRRGLVGVVLGAMPGAAVLAGRAAQGAGAGYVKLLGDGPLAVAVPADLVVAPRDLAEPRLGALLVGPGLGRDGEARARLAEALGAGHRLVLDADALHLLRRGDALPE